ncbi:MAG: peptidase T [Bacillota bacterium]
MEMKERFLKYVQIDTQSNESSETCPSTEKQYDLLKILKKDLIEIGMDHVELDSNGYIYATLEKNVDKSMKNIGFIAHVDTAPSFNGKNINPIVIDKYDGNDFVLNEKKDIVLKTKDFPEILNYKGQELIVTDGTSLLGADDKAGICEIMEALKFIIDNDIKHGNIQIAFTPDEEIGRGADKFDVQKFGADYAYTIDGGEIGELQFENFNAASAHINIQGVNVHPGSAKNKMINSLRIGFELDNLLPEFDRPEYTQDYEGFFHLLNMDGDVENTKMHYIIRDHDKEKFNKKKTLIKNACEYLNEKYDRKIIDLELEDSYYNMREKITPVYEIVENAKKAMEEEGVEPIVKPIRGGTDGARLSYMGLPTPNIFTGGHNFHGKFEYIPIKSMIKAKDVIINLCMID